MNPVSFKNENELTDFLKKIPYKIVNNIDCGILGEFKRNRILYTADHAVTSVIKTPEYGKKTYIRLGDRNTDKLAMIMANTTKSSFIIPRFSRLDADPCRPLGALGKKEEILIKVSGLNQKRYFLIHRNRDYAQYLLKYHSLIDRLNPSAIVSLHGMIEKGHPPDILLGFGRNCRIIEGKSNAIKFKKLFIKKTEKALETFGIENDLNIKISKLLFTGEKNYVLSRHVIQYNKKNKRKRFGMHVEFNSRGRIYNNSFIREDYQIASRVLAKTVSDWLNHLKT